MNPSFQSIMQALSERSYAPVYFLQGPETYYIDTITDYIEKNVLSKQEKTLNLRTYYGKEQSLRSIISHARCVPMLAAHQVIIVKEAQEMADLQNAKAQKYLANYLKTPNKKTILLFAHKYKTLKNKSLLQHFNNRPHILFTTPRMYEKQLPAWIQQYVAAKGYFISPEATLILQGLLGTNLRLLDNELQKIMLNLPEKATITVPLVIKHVGMQRTSNPFELQRSIGLKQIDQSLHILLYLINNLKKNPAILIVSVLTTFFLKLLQFHHLANKSPHEQASMLQIPPYFIKDYQQASRQHTAQSISKHLEALHKADLQLKGISSNLHEKQILKELVAKLLYT